MALYPGYAQKLVAQGYTGYQGWGDDEAHNDFQATHGAGKGGITTPDQSASNVIQSSLDAWTKLVQETSRRFTDYQKTNPFMVDDVLKQKAVLAKEQLDPYYNEQLGNYLLGTQRKLERGATDTQNLLSELSGQSQYFTQDTQMKLDNALQNARQGYANAGLYDSGARMRTEGLLGAESGLASENYLRGQSYRENQANLGLQRTQQDYGLGNLMGQNLKDIGSLDLTNPGVGPAVATDIRNTQRERMSAEDILGSQLTKEAGQKYVTGFNATLPTEFQGSNLDLLKKIGIYS